MAGTSPGSPCRPVSAVVWQFAHELSLRDGTPPLLWNAVRPLPPAPLCKRRGEALRFVQPEQNDAARDSRQQKSLHPRPILLSAAAEMS
jgi:hypothetical protein